MSEIRLQTGKWYEDKSIMLRFPDNWDVTTHWPNTPKPLTESEISERLDQPVGCASLAEQLAGKRKIAIVTDDLSRPTPAFRVLPELIDRILAACDAPQISIVVATGTHGHQDEKGLRSKLGKRAWEHCSVEVHDDLTKTKRVGKTTYKTPVYVNRVVHEADLTIGIGGVYPQYTTGFGGGGKLALGVCGRQTIMGLHFKHKSMEGKYNTDNDFRKDVCEVARIIGLNSIINIHIDAFSEIVNVVFGDHGTYYDDAARFSKEHYTAPIADDFDLVIANAYPLDTSFTFMRKGYKPLYTSPRSAVKVIIAAAHEGIGVHGLFQYINPSRLDRYRNLAIRALSMDKKELLGKVWNRVAGIVKKKEVVAKQEEKTTILPPNTEHLYVLRTDPNGAEIQPLDDVTICNEWSELLKLLGDSHFPPGKTVSVALYPCAPIQCIDDV